jgi:hypothetical protein
MRNLFPRDCEPRCAQAGITVFIYVVFFGYKSAFGIRRRQGQQHPWSGKQTRRREAWERILNKNESAARKKLKATTTSDKERPMTALPLWKSLTRSLDGKYLTIDEPNKDVKKALRFIGHGEPAVILDWDIAALNNAVAHVNAVRPALPNWIFGGYPITAEGLQRDIVANIAVPGGGLHGNTLFAPNTMVEFAAVTWKMDGMMPDPFILAMCAPPNCRPLARIFTMADSRNNTTGRATPPPERKFGVRCFE